METKEKKEKGKNGGLPLDVMLAAGLSQMGVILILGAYGGGKDEPYDKFEEDLKQLLGSELPQSVLTETHEKFLNNLGLSFETVESADKSLWPSLDPSPIFLENRKRIENAADVFLAATYAAIGKEQEKEVRESIERLAGQAFAIMKDSGQSLGETISSIGVQISEQTESNNISPVTEGLNKSFQVKVIYRVIDWLEGK